MRARFLLTTRGTFITEVPSLTLVIFSNNLFKRLARIALSLRVACRCMREIEETRLRKICAAEFCAAMRVNSATAKS